MVAGPESTGHGLQCFGMDVERRDVLKRYTSAPRCPEGHQGKPGCARLRQRVHPGEPRMCTGRGA
jgi:hypothetical protein